MILKTLGGLMLTGSKLQRPKPLLLLAYLSIEGAKDRRHLSELFYSDTADPMAGLRIALKHIREGASEVLVAEGDKISVKVTCDARQFLVLLEQHDDTEASKLYQGSFLANFYLKDLSAELEEWLLGTRDYFAGLARQVMLRLAESFAVRGNVEIACRHAERAYSLADTLPPEPRQLEFIYKLLVASGSPKLARLRGEFADLGMPLPMADEFFSLSQRPQEATPSTHNLPLPSSSLVGRQQALHELTQFLQDPRYRLITLSGPGGIGKTRLSLELAHSQLSGQWDGVYFVALESLQDASFIPVQIATTLGYRLESHDPPLMQLTRLIGQKPLLLILDNFEHLTAGAAILNELLTSFPQLKLLVTSRERLNLANEAVYELEGLALPPASFTGDVQTDTLGASIELFVQRVQQANLRFSLTPDNLVDIVHICRLVEGVPLALELAAAWVRIMPLKDIAKEISGTPDFLVSQKQDALARHKSLRAVFEHSWKLLKPAEQEVLQNLSVFRGGFRREAAASVTGATIPVLVSLVDKSLLRVSAGGRYDRHMMLYQFAREKLAQHPELEQSYLSQHAQYFLSLAETAESQLRLVNQTQWLRKLDEDANNFHAALNWSLQTQDVELSLRLVGAMGLYWYLKSSFDEGRTWYDRVLARVQLPFNRLSVKVLHNAGRLARSYGDFVKAQGLLEQCLTLCQSIDDKVGMVKSFNELGILTAVQSDYTQAKAIFEQGFNLAKTIHDDEGLGLILSNLGFLNTIVGSLQVAEEAFEQGLTISRQRGDKHTTAHLLNNLALVALRQKDYIRSTSLYAESLNLSQELQDKQGMAESMLGLGKANQFLENTNKARLCIRQSLNFYVELRKTPDIIEVLCETASLAAQQDPLLASHLWGMTDALRKRLNFPMPPFEHERYQQILDRIRSQLETERFEQAYAEGELWSLDDAIQGALGWLSQA